MAQEGDTILIPEGKFYLERSLWGDNLINVTIKGYGIDKTILSFKKQIEGAEGLKIINSNNIILKDFLTNEEILNYNISLSSSYKVKDKYSETKKIEDKTIENLVNKIYQNLIIKISEII